MDVSVVIRAKDEAQFIGETLKKVAEQNFNGSYEIIVVDSGSRDHTIDIVRESDVRLLEIKEEEFTYGRALNLGASHAKGGIIVNLSAHAVPKDNHWLANLVDGFHDSNVAGVYGRQLSLPGVNPFECLQNDTFFGSEKLVFNKDTGDILSRIHFSNANSAIRKEIWEAFKFNEEVPYAEDMYWQRAVIEAGFSIIYEPEAVVHHTHQVSIKKVYENSKKCAYALALMKQKERSVVGLMCDTIMFLGLIPNVMAQNVTYVLKKQCFQHLKIAPLYVLSALLGWLSGRAEYRLN